MSVYMDENVVFGTVVRGRCSGCGVCAGVCPSHALEMHVNPEGDLVPRLVATCRPTCDLCLQVCPFVDSVYDPRRMQESLVHDGCWGEEGLQFDPHTGWYRDSCVGYSPEHRPDSASGGLLSFCLEKMLENHMADSIATVGPNIGGNGPLFMFRAASSVADLRQCAGSVYMPVSIDAMLRQIVEMDERRWAVVGVPCVCSAVRRASRRLPRLRRRITFVLGLACGMYQNQFYTELLSAHSGIPWQSISQVRYRIKSQDGPAGDYGFQAHSDQGERGMVVPYHGLPLFLGRNGYFRCNACNYCKDVFAETADACFMDAWILPYRVDPAGNSIVLVRHPTIFAVFQSARDAERLVLSQLSVQQVVRSQQHQVVRKLETISLRVGQARGTIWQRWEWRLQQRAQTQSKRVWSRIGRQKGIEAFWLGMLGIRVAQAVLRYAVRLASYPHRIIRRVLNWEK